jgi:hypothetical protein
VGGVGVGAYALTDLVANKWLGLDAKIGGWLSGQNNYDPNKGHSPHIASKRDQTVVVRSPVYLDGRLISDNTAGHLAGDFGMASGMMYDPTMTLPPVGLNFAR